MLSLAVDYAICERLCVPAQARMQVTLPERISAWDTVLAQAQARVPKKRAVGEGSSLVIRAVHHERREPRGRAVVDLAAPAVGELDLFVEGPTPDWALPVPIPLQPTPAGLRGYSMLSVIQMRPRSSKHIAIGFTMSGSLATNSTAKPFGTDILLRASCGE